MSSTSGGVTTWTVPNLPVPPSEVLVTSNKGGVDSEDVVITGAEDPSAQVVATITGDTNSVQVGQAVTLDALASVGTITSYNWSVSPAASLTGTGGSRTFTATTPGTYVDHPHRRRERSRQHQHGPLHGDRLRPRPHLRWPTPGPTRRGSSRPPP